MPQRQLPPYRAAEVAVLVFVALFLLWVVVYRHYAERDCARSCHPDGIESYGPPCTCFEPEEP